MDGALHFTLVVPERWDHITLGYFDSLMKLLSTDLLWENAEEMYLEKIFIIDIKVSVKAIADIDSKIVP